MDHRRVDSGEDELATEDELSPQDPRPVRARQDTPAEQFGAWAGENPGLAGVGLILGGAALHSFLSTGSGSKTTKVSAEDDPDEVLAEALSSLNMEPNHADDLAEEIVGRLPDDMDNLETFNELQKRMMAEGFKPKRIGECWDRIKEQGDDE